MGNLTQIVNSAKDNGSKLIKQIDDYFDSIAALFANEEEFIDVEIIEKVKAECADYQTKIGQLSILSKFLNVGLSKRNRELASFPNAVKNDLTGHNDLASAITVPKARKIIGDVEGRQLDGQQMKCIVRPMHNQLVIAGAGTGKTTTIVGKVKYLLLTETCDAKDILVLSFTNASASEMGERINTETKKNIEASTFHKLGMNIIREVEGITPKISSIELRKYVQEQLQENMKDVKYLRILNRYFLSRNSKSEFDFKDGSEYQEYLRTNPPTTLKGEKVKSHGEKDIANFLFLNGISYEYEKEYEVDTRTKDRAQYYPDFYLTDYGIYIEYFGINENGEVPSFFTSRNGKTASEEYREGMEWKRKLHKDNKTQMIGVYAYERANGELQTSLEKSLKHSGVEFNPLPPEIVWEKVEESNSKNFISAFADLLATIISLMKSNGYDILQLREVCKKLPLNERNSGIVELVEPIYEAYKKALKESGEIDFDDMINKAAEYVKEGKYTNSYKQVIVDEYQDISKSRYNLLKALRESSDYKLFCVGDDWQSIYRFTGSDLDYILEFEKYWGATELSRIETTYRFTDSLIDISGKFVMQNPLQIKKSIKGTPSKCGFAMGEIKGYTEEIAIRFMLEKLRDLPEESTVFFIGRYTFDVKLLDDNASLQCKYNIATQTTDVFYSERPDLKMTFITAHRSKGLQADYVFIINNKDNGLGFPSKIQNDPIIECLLGVKESFPYAEERRLFYVALTRAKVKTYLIVRDGDESAFTSELEKRYSKELKNEKFVCPLCGGRLSKRKGPYGEFFGCENYSTTGCKYTRKI